MMDNLALLTDLYEFSMANGYAQTLPDEEAVFDVFYRKVPDQGSFVIAAGLAQVVETVRNWHFDEAEIDYLRGLNLFSEAFLTQLAEFKNECEITAMPEGTPVFPQEPLLTIQGPLWQTQLLETFVLNLVNHQSLIATKARRITVAAEGRPVMEFGARRAQGPDAATLGARAAIIGGCASTSNVLAAKRFNLPSAGTMAHAWIEAFPDELTAFQKWAAIYPDNASLLVDTYDVLSSGVPNAIRVFKQLAAAGHRPVGIRIDSGDIAQLAAGARRQLDEAGFIDAKITASNALDEAVMTSLLKEGAPIDNFGVGEQLITSASSPVLSGVYKLAAISQNGQLIPKIKVSASREKTTLPGLKRVYRLYQQGTTRAIGDVIALADEKLASGMTVVALNPLATRSQQQLGDFVARELQHTVLSPKTTAAVETDCFAIQRFGQQRLAELPEATQRLVNPDHYPVYITQQLAELQADLIAQQHAKN